MKRDFREEYEEYMKKETPDLWDRIEKGISENNPEDRNEKVVPLLQRDPAYKTAEPPKTRKILPFRRITAAVAAICVLIVGIGSVNTLQRGRQTAQNMANENLSAKANEPGSEASAPKTSDSGSTATSTTFDESPAEEEILTEESSPETATIPSEEAYTGSAESAVDTFAEYDDGLVMAGAYEEAYDTTFAASKEAYWTDVPYMEPAPVSGETYEKTETTGFSLVSTEPLSTFSADVDTASYTNVRRMIEDGWSIDWIDPDAVRPEEFINYFSYDLKDPEAGEKFGITTQVAVCPWNEKHQILFAGIKTEDIDLSEAPPENLTFLLDVSGSMDEPDKLPLLQKAFLQLVDQLDEDDTVSIVTYANGVEVVLDSVRGSDKKAITAAINDLVAEGGTYGEGGIQKAYELAEQNYREGANNRILLATDGDLNIGISEPDELEKFIEKKRDKGIFLSVLGFGTGNIRDDNMERLADCGNGNYAYIDSPLEARKVMVEEMGASFHTVAQDVKLQVEFNPETVNAYRLIGYENRLMEATDFRDDTKDAGEIGAGHSVIALYELIPAGSEQAVELKYQNKENRPAAVDEEALRPTDSQEPLQDSENNDETLQGAESNTDKEAVTNLAEDDKPDTKTSAASAYADEYATVSVRYKEPGEATAKENAYVVSKENFTEEPDSSLLFASAAAEFAMILRDDPNKGSASLEAVMEMARNSMGEDEYRQEFYYMVRLLMKNSQ